MRKYVPWLSIRQFATAYLDPLRVCQYLACIKRSNALTSCSVSSTRSVYSAFNPTLRLALYFEGITSYLDSLRTTVSSEWSVCLVNNGVTQWYCLVLHYAASWGASQAAVYIWVQESSRPDSHAVTLDLSYKDKDFQFDSDKRPEPVYSVFPVFRS